MKLRLLHLYPDQMNLYGDFGNILSLRRRAEWRGIEFETLEVGVGQAADFTRTDLIFMGGGQDRGQGLVAPDLMKRAEAIKAAVEDGLAGLLICGGYQLFGEYFQTLAGTRIPGLGILPVRTVAGPKRLIGNLIGQLVFPRFQEHFTVPLIPDTIVGFENHSGQTYLSEGAVPLARVIRGFGNNSHDRTEGVVYQGLIGSYCHGSLLPKNPQLSDHLLRSALIRRYGESDLTPLNDEVELAAHRAAITRAKRAKSAPL